jgi:UTP:GlnB (protein PII) uridylyltransferase
MKDYYEHTRNIFRVTERITEQFAARRSSNGTHSAFAFLEPSHEDEEDLGPFVRRDRQLFVKSADAFRRRPELLMHAFQVNAGTSSRPQSRARRFVVAQS